METGSLGKRPEIAVTCQEGNTLVDTGLSNQRIAQTSPPPP